MKQQTTNYLFGALAAAVVFAAMPSDAFATVANLAGMENQVKSQAGGLTNIVSMVCYTVGTMLSGLGVYKLKKHAENAAQVPLNQPLTALGVGAGLLSLPWITSFATSTVGTGTQKAAFTNFNAF